MSSSPEVPSCGCTLCQRASAEALAQISPTMRNPPAAPKDSPRRPSLQSRLESPTAAPVAPRQQKWTEEDAKKAADALLHREYVQRHREWMERINEEMKRYLEEGPTMTKEEERKIYQNRPARIISFEPPVDSDED
ncbi:hypothetical protein DL93DRAFT_2089519 [Clavulina sp. PMI_390]|nr:hypothetical protein DL93DRAFT_2089519 [Clavulina sp. PMI_390]